MQYFCYLVSIKSIYVDEMPSNGNEYDNTREGDLGCTIILSTITFVVHHIISINLFIVVETVTPNTSNEIEETQEGEKILIITQTT